MKLSHIVSVLVMVLVTQVQHAQWTKGKNKGYYKLGFWSLVADQHYTDTGNIAPNPTRGTFNLNFYGEYGLTDQLDAIAYVPFFTRTYLNTQISGTTGNIKQEGEALNSIGDADIGLRYQLLKKDHLALSSTLKLGLPLGESAGGSDGSFQTGDGEFNQLLQLDLGVPFSIQKANLYAKTYLGFNNRSKGFSDEMHFGGEAGLGLWDSKIWLIARINRVQSLQNGSASPQNNQGSIFANNIEFTSIGYEAAYYITKKFGASISYATATAGRLTFANPTISGGVFLDIK